MFMLMRVFPVAVPIPPTQEGDGIVINQPDQFAKVVLPKYYKHSNYHSFVRQVWVQAVATLFCVVM